MSAAQNAMNTLNSQWYNILVSQLGNGLDPSTFQLIQAYEAAGTTSEWLWNIFDAVPPASISNYYNPTQLNHFSQDYAGVSSALIPQGQLQFEEDMGSSYTAWNNYKKTISPIPTSPLEWINAFTNWANVNLQQSIVTKAINDYKSMLTDPIVVAQNMLLQLQYAAKNPGIYAYTTTYNQLQVALNKSEPGKVTLDSSTDSSDISHTWAKTEVGGFFDIFAGAGDSSYDKYTTQVSQAGVKIEASFDKVANFSGSPLYEPSGDVELQNYTPWFNSAALHEGYSDKSNNTWKSGDAINWNSTFGPNGNLPRITGALIIVDGINLSLTSNCELDSGDRTTFKAAAEGGIWPFFEASGSGGWNTTTTFDDSGNVTVSSVCAAGNPQILGAIVTPITDLWKANS
ncbi:MAG: hypothetical protein COB20_13890 [SAR86 cluster bacterium]|uniref:Uncharacterized protein n=1 Tax=SAR86 cluster bacterium TaxID=2030880 RepID=A0A2A4WX80_9GAMM|nr:MAG: hypothetical protein COB20_13890 [SAR86 cluster bacterium]